MIDYSNHKENTWKGKVGNFDVVFDSDFCLVSCFDVCLFGCLFICLFLIDLLFN